MAGPKYVKEFEFPSSAGFTKSGGNMMREVRFFARGGPAAPKKIAKVMGEFKSGDLHSGSKLGPLVTNPAQATAIAMSEAGMSKKPNFVARAKRPGGFKRGGKAEMMRGRMAEGPEAMEPQDVEPGALGSRRGVPVASRKPLIRW